MRNLHMKNRYIILEKDNDNNSDFTSKWKILQEAVVKSAKECIPKKEKYENQKWMKTEMLDLMDKRRTVKMLDKEIKLRCNEAKDKWLNDNCEELESLEKKDIQLMHCRIKELTNMNKHANTNCNKS